MGDPVPAATLHRMGLVNRLAADAEELAHIAGQFTAALAALDSLAVRLTKETHRALSTMPLDQALNQARNLNALLMASGRIEAGAKAFASRRKG